MQKTIREAVEGESSSYYASFLRIFGSEDYAELLNAEPSEHFKFDSSFISYFPHDVVSSPIHAAPMVHTYSVQCYGVKAWLFWSSRVLNRHRHYTVTHPAGGVLSGTPESIMRIPTSRAVVGPNDLLVFPPLFYHAVASAAGKNIMFSIRRADRDSLRASLKQSAHDSLLWFLRYVYDRPLFERLLGRNDLAADAGGTAKVGFTDNDDTRSFQEKYKSRVPRAYVDHPDFGNYDGLEHFNLPNPKPQAY